MPEGLLDMSGKVAGGSGFGPYGIRANTIAPGLLAIRPGDTIVIDGGYLILPH